MLLLQVFTPLSSPLTLLNAQLPNPDSATIGQLSVPMARFQVAMDPVHDEDVEDVQAPKYQNSMEPGF
jgi:hypothetical protein